MKTAELIGAALDWAVAKIEGWLDEADDPNDGYEFKESVWDYGNCNYSKDWIQGGPIIEREEMQIWKGGEWCAALGNSINTPDFYTGPTPLIAAMRAYVASKLGNEVEIPKEIQK